MSDEDKEIDDAFRSAIVELAKAHRSQWLESDERKVALEQFPNQHHSFDSPLMPAGEPFPGKTYRADGWGYFDPPTRFSPEMWELFLNSFGEENVDYVILAMSQGTSKEGVWVRGQILASPQGIENALENAKKMREEQSE